MDSGPIRVGGDKQLFIDHRFIERSEQVTLRVNPPRKDTVDRFPRDKPWEAFTTGWYSIDWGPGGAALQEVVRRLRRRPVGRRELAALLRGVGGRAWPGRSPTWGWSNTAAPATTTS